MSTLFSDSAPLPGHKSRGNAGIEASLEKVAQEGDPNMTRISNG
jgi:hypothetical protein